MSDRPNHDLPPLPSDTPRKRFGYDDLEVGYDDFEPDGELFAKNASVHIERMDHNYWWMAITTAEDHEVHVTFHSSRAITVRWEDQTLGDRMDAKVKALVELVADMPHLRMQDGTCFQCNAQEAVGRPTTHPTEDGVIALDGPDQIQPND